MLVNSRVGVVTFSVVLLSACATLPPEQPHDICKVFKEKPDWHEAALDMKERWGVPVHIPMAIMYQESSFKYDAAPPMEYFLGFIPIGRASDAYGYSQAKTPVWGEYIEDAGSAFADRDDFEDAIDFVGWYMNRSSKINKVSKWDTYAQYLNYHEGHGGYRRGTYQKKPWLIKVARKVEARAKKYSEQYWGCKDDLNVGWFW